MSIKNKNKYTKQFSYGAIICFMGAGIVFFFDWLNSKNTYTLVSSILFLASGIFNIIALLSKSTKK